MIIFIDEQPVETKARSIAEVLQDAQQILQERGRIVVQVEMNGRHLVGQELVGQRDSDVIAAQIKIGSADPRDMAISTLQAVRRALRDVIEAQRDAALLLREGNANEAVEILAEVFDVWRQTQEAVLVSCEVVGFKLEEHLYEGRSVNIFLSHLLEEVDRLHKMLQQGDREGVATLLTTQWVTLAERWDVFIGQVITWFGAQ